MEHSITDFVNARYVANPDDHAYICGRSLLAPDKGGGDAQPIVSSLSISRIALRVGMVQDRATIAKVFSQVNQFGIGVDGGVVHVYIMNHIALLELIDSWETTSLCLYQRSLCYNRL